MNAIENLLRREIGLDAASVGSSLIERTIRLRMKARGLAKPAEYLALLTTSSSEWEELIEAVVITETWFFRDQGSFTAFVQFVQRELMTQTASDVVRILSLPCSTGEEPYSLAMALLDAGVPRHRFVIEALDVSARALERARKAIYGKNSFRGKSLEFRERHFTPTGEGWELHETVRQCVEFQRGNLLAEEFLTRRTAYEIIFCRNLLIYFDRATQALALAKLYPLLTPLGFLFVSPAEMPLVSVHGFVSAGLPMAFACRKAADLADRHTAPCVASSEWRVPSPTRNAERGTRNAAVVIPRPEPETQRPASHRAAKVQLDLDAARALADAGKLAEATAICEAHVKVEGPSAQAYYLIGLIHEADGDPGALEYYRKALYLEPNHYESLLQMSLLLEKTGDTSGARRFQRRVERLKSRNSDPSQARATRC